jgi:hypothetical protein
LHFLFSVLKNKVAQSADLGMFERRGKISEIATLETGDMAQNVLF